MKLKIKVTKDVLRRSMWCGTKNDDSGFQITTNCALAIAVRDIFPDASAGYQCINPFHSCNRLDPKWIIQHDAESFIRSFDILVETPEKRLELPEYEFEVELSDELVELINISDIHKSPTLEVVSL